MPIANYRTVTTFLCIFLTWSVGLPAQLVGDKQNGLASYYSTEYDGAETAYGTIYNKNELVAAHKAYPYNSTVRVRNEENGKSVVVRIIDKGPFIRGRIVELSERAAAEIDMLGQRTVPVELTLLSTPEQRRSSVTPPPSPVETVPEVATRPVPPPDPTPVVVEPAVTQPVVVAPDKATSPPAPSRSKPAATFSPGIYHIELEEPGRGRYAVQVGSFTNLERAMDKVAELQGRYFDDILLHKLPGRQGGYKVLLGPFRDRDSAANYTADLQRRYNIKGFPVDMGEKFP